MKVFFASFMRTTQRQRKQTAPSGGGGGWGLFKLGGLMELLRSGNEGGKGEVTEDRSHGLMINSVVIAIAPPPRKLTSL